MLSLYLTYGVYDSIHPAFFIRGSRYFNTSYGLATPPISPSRSSQENSLFEIFLTLEIGERTAGVLHGGVAKVEFEKRSTSVDVTVKLAFTNEQQRKLAHELSMYTLLEGRCVKGVPTALGIFHEAAEKGPSCLVISDAGVSLEKRKTCITAKQRYVFI